MELSLLEIWESMGILARLVAIGLLGMGVASLAVSFERLFILMKMDRESLQFATRSRSLMNNDELSDVRALAKSFPKNPLARMTLRGLETYDAQGESPRAVEFTRRDMGRQLEELATEARRGMGLLASVGSTAPFIGLFGTVIGIITAFQGIAAAGGGGIGAVSAGIAEALIVTAVGLFVAIAAVLFFNYLSGRMDRLDTRMQHSAGELIDYLERNHGDVR